MHGMFDNLMGLIMKVKARMHVTYLGHVYHIYQSILYQEMHNM